MFFCNSYSVLAYFRTSIFTILLIFKGSSFSRCNTVNLVCLVSNNLRLSICAKLFYNQIFMPQQFICFFKHLSKNCSRQFIDSIFHGIFLPCGEAGAVIVTHARSHICFLKFLDFIQPLTAVMVLHFKSFNKKCANPFLSQYGPYPKTA